MQGDNKVQADACMGLATVSRRQEGHERGGVVADEGPLVLAMQKRRHVPASPVISQSVSNIHKLRKRWPISLPNELAAPTLPVVLWFIDKRPNM